MYMYEVYTVHNVLVGKEYNDYMYMYESRLLYYKC